ncbi:laminin G [Streptomyces sp. A7024]|uniref:exo-alpha-sialidase n=1 Tax=Streptomyces coryli TaxID=1128680 RepID=A0A6G4UDB4_9ACTN|nr:sialidase family protein [Streptomyces coryli]NGN70002.1 laminin G [Streptomyces coryli]
MCHAPARVLVVLAAALAAVVGLTAPAGRAAPTTDPHFDQQVLFKAANEQGYSCFRIPAVVKTTKGTLLAFAEGRVNNCGDADDIDLVLKRSFDGGKTWTPLQVIHEGGGDTNGNPVPIVDRDSGRITLISNRNEGVGSAANCAVPCKRDPYIQHSDDDGETWSEQRALGAEAKDPDWNSWYATGPLHGIQLKHGRHAGRLVFGINAETWNDAESRVTHNHAALAYSDDGGAHWKIGALDTFPIAADGTFEQKPSEMTLVERRDGSIYVNGREQDGTDLGHRDFAVSPDGGESFANGGFKAIPDLHTPMVQGSSIQLRSKAEDGYDRWLLSAPADPDRRRTMMIRSSYDEGRSWEAVDRGKTVTTDWSGYSDMAKLSDGEVGLLYEGGPVDARDEIRFARFNEAWLGPRRAPDPRTPDEAPGASDGYVIGGVRPTDGHRGGPRTHGGAASFDGVDGHVRLPFRSAQALGKKDFTASVWFRYSATSGEQPLLWMGGVGTKSPYVALRALPGENRLVAEMTPAPDGPIKPPLPVVQASAPAAYNDGEWHHAVIRRGGGSLTLSVDGAAAVSAPDAGGSLSRNSTFAVHLGQKMDSRVRYQGDLDDVRVYDRALGAGEVTALREGSHPRHGLIVDVPLDRLGRG